MKRDPQPIRRKIDIVFEKEGPARFVSHHDLMRLFARALRRAELPVRLTEGFNPQPRMVFPAPLSLGIESDCEHLEIEFAREVEPREAFERLAGQMVPGLRLCSVETLPPRRKGRHPTGFAYALTGIPASAQAGLEEAARELAEASSLPMQRGGRKGTRTVEVAPSIAAVETGPGELRVRLVPQRAGTARPGELAVYLAGRLGLEPSELRIRRTAIDLAA